MPQQHNALPSNQEGRIELALHAYQSHQISSLRRAAAAYSIPKSTLSDRINGITPHTNRRPGMAKLTATEEQTLIQYILDLDSRGFAPRLTEVEDMANKLLAARHRDPVGQCWAQRFIKRVPELKMAWNRAKDRQRIRQEDPEVINAWFRLVEDTKAKYGVQDQDVHNFDETGFQMGVIGSMKVVTGSERRARPTLVQPGDREWVTVIQSVCAAGYAAPPFIIYKGRVHISAWYEEANIPRDWKLSVSENGWTNNELGVAWLKHFDAYTKPRMVGSWRLLILDGHESHQSQDFKDYCLEQKILTLCMPAHSSHILQPLDVVCFAPLKLKYSQRVRDLARKRVYHIDKEGFLPAFRDAFFDVFTLENCKKAFEASGLIPLDALVVIDRLDVRLNTPPALPLPDEPWQSKRPKNAVELSSQAKLVMESIRKSPTAVTERLAQLAKGAESLAHQDVLMMGQLTELREQIEVLSKRKARKRKRLQHGGVLDFGRGADLVAESPSVATRASKRARVGGDAEGQLSTQRRCGRCGETGHNARTCQKDEQSPSESDITLSGLFSDSVHSESE